MRYSGKDIKRSGRRRPLLIMALAVFGVLLGAALVLAAGRPTHMSRFENPEGCAGCHAGKGVPGTPLLKARREQLCFRCHGALSHGLATGRNIQSVVSKQSNHPITETSLYHLRGEVLPEEEESMLRHVACADCHVAHISTPELTWRGARGYISGLSGAQHPGLRPQGLRLRQATDEYELCYLCHSDSRNLPAGSRNMAELFNPSNFSYHPVEAPGRNLNMPSLVRALSITDRIRCTDCHGNNDSMGPRGPHGSDYSPILVAQYSMEDGPEDARYYELCYMCHDRRSILGDESFRKHNRHVVSEQTSCFTCHASHGSSSNNLIEFNTLVVNPSLTDGGPMYMPGSGGNPMCYLECHGADHNFTGIFVEGVQTGIWP
jgi:predicted CXXCH cytochrome family protein